MLQRTLAIVKPDGVQTGVAGQVAMRLRHLSRPEAEGFYAVHKERPFFKDLVAFMTSGPVILMCLERENAIAHWREIMGATDPAKAAPGTIRKLFATDIEKNVSHGSDAEATASFELGWFFRGCELS